MNFLLETVDYTKPINSFGEQFKFGLETLLLGMAAVFSVLCVIWLALVIFKMAFKNVSKEKSDKQKSTPVVSAPAPIAQSSLKKDADEELIAVITAAIAMAESENNGMKFKVVSFKKR